MATSTSPRPSPWLLAFAVVLLVGVVGVRSAPSSTLDDRDEPPSSLASSSSSREVDGDPYEDEESNKARRDDRVGLRTYDPRL
jgi:hypothetical protein